MEARLRPGLDVRGLVVMLMNSHLACDATKSAERPANKACSLQPVSQHSAMQFASLIAGTNFYSNMWIEQLANTKGFYFISSSNSLTSMVKLHWQHIYNAFKSRVLTKKENNTVSVTKRSAVIHHAIKTT